MQPVDIALLGFLPWTDPSRDIAVSVNPSALSAEGCAKKLSRDGYRAAFVPVAVSEEGIEQARGALERMEPKVVVAVGQTKGAPRVERWGQVPSSLAPARADEVTPWLLAPDADELASLLADIDDPAAKLLPFGPSDDAGGYFCDKLCVELVRYSRRKGAEARFLHVTAIDDVPATVAEARVKLYECHIAATVRWLVSRRESQHAR